MPSPDQEHKSDSTSLDAERARLRSAGYTDAEVSQILIASASQQPAATGQGALSNVLSSILGVASHARALIPTFRKDVETVFDGAATASARAGAVAWLAVKATVVIVLGYAAYQEWSQHILSSPTTAQYQAIKAKADACLAMTETAGKTMSGRASNNARAQVQAQIDAVCQEVWNLPPAVFHDHDPQGGLLQTIVPHDAPPAAPTQNMMTFYRQRFKDAGVPEDQIGQRAKEACLREYVPELCDETQTIMMRYRQRLKGAGVPEDQIEQRAKEACLREWVATLCDEPSPQAAEAPDPDPPSWARFWRITRANMFSWTNLWHWLLFSVAGGVIVGAALGVYVYLPIYAKNLWSRFRAARAAK